MFEIKKTTYGFRLVFAGIIAAPEMQRWVEESKKALVGAPPKFGVFVDMRDLKPLSGDAKLVMEEGQKAFKMKGMARSVVILSSQIITIQFRDIAKKSGIDAWERYINAEGNPKWEVQGIAWIQNGTEPPK